MSTMGVGTQSFAASKDTPSKEYEQEYGLDNEEEGFVSKGRAANYIAVEDKLICAAYRKVGLDPAVGVDQPKEAYWMRMWEYFVAWNTSGKTSCSCTLAKWMTSKGNTLSFVVTKCWRRNK